MADLPTMDEVPSGAKDSKGKSKGPDNEDNSEASSKANTSEEIKLKSWINSMGTMLGSIDFKESQACSISIVPEHLRKSNEDAYIPKVVSIGPLHRKSKRDLLYMEEIKWRCMASLLERTQDPIESFKGCSKAILELDEIVRASYLDDIKFDSYDLAKIMLLDGCFLLELLISGSQDLNTKLPSTSPGPGAEVGQREDILSDLIVLENQIPFLVLNKLSQLLFPEHFTKNEGPRKIKDLALSVLGYSPSSNSNTDFKAAHLLELFHSAIPIGVTTEPSDIEANLESHPKLKRCATRLEAAGVTIKSPASEANPNQCFLDRVWKWLKNVTDRKPEEKEQKQAAPAGFDLNIKFSKNEGKLEIGQLHITETTEVRWRNFIAWEQNRNDRAKLIDLEQREAKIDLEQREAKIDLEQREAKIDCKFSWYALFFLGLICCVHDVQLLRDRKVIVVHDAKSTDNDKKKKKIMSNEDLVTFFRKITEGFEDVQMDMDPHLRELFKYLNSHESTVTCAAKSPGIMWHFFRRHLTEIWYFCRKWLNIKALFRDYFPTGWKLIAVIFGVLVSVSSIISTFFPHLIAGMTKKLDEAGIRENLLTMGQGWEPF